MTVFFRSWTFWVALCSWFVFMGGHYATVVPAPYGLVLANFVAIIYAVLRCLTKRKAGVPWKGILFTSEFGVTAATVLMNFLESISKIPSLSPKLLALISAAVVGLGSLLHTLSSTRTATPDLSNLLSEKVTTSGTGQLSGTIDVKGQGSHAVEPAKKTEAITLPHVEAIKDLLSGDNLSTGVPDKTHEDSNTPTVPLKDPGIEWFQYVVSDDKSQIVTILSLVPGWDDVEMVSFLGKRGIVPRPATCTLRVLQKDDKGMKVFQTIDDTGKTLIFESRRSMGAWKVQP